MTDKFLSTDPYKGVRDFYPEDMAVQQYIFDTWAYTAESFGFERYDASVLEPSALYKAKGAENEEMVNEQTYTFVDRGEREVTLRPEMTPTVARMIAKKQKELAFPVRWYSIPNLFRYERAQRGRLREHWQLNCDIFGSTDISVDVEIIALAYQIFMNFGADENMFEILVNNRQTMRKAYEMLGITDDTTINMITRLNDKKDKIAEEDYIMQLVSVVNDESLAKEIKDMIESKDTGDSAIVAGLNELGINNVRLDRSLARGFDYYTGTIFEFKDKAEGNNRSLLGGGRYDNLTSLFGDEAVPGVGFGFGDVTMRDFLETHNLMSISITAPTVMILPTEMKFNMAGQKIAQRIRNEAQVSVATDVSSRKISKKIADASDKLVDYVIVVGEDELQKELLTLKHLISGEEITDNLNALIHKLIK